MTRIVGLDVARGLAVIGMIAAHVGDDGTRGGDAEGWAWLALAHGRPSALFAVLTGVTMAIMLASAGGRGRPRAVRRTRVRIATRAVILIALGMVLADLGTGVDVVLVNLGLIMLMALPMLRVPSWALLAGAGVAFAIGRWLVATVQPDGWWHDAPVVGRLWSFHYPALSWIGYALLGLAIGRLALRETRTQLALLGLGAALTGVTVLIRIVAGDGPVTGLVPHSYTPLEMTSNAATAVAVIGGCCWLAPRWRTALSPIEAVGAMALTAYVLHLLIIAAVGSAMVYQPSNVAWVVLEVVVIGACWGWRRWRGQGPLERGLTWASNLAGDLAVPARTAPAEAR